MLGGVGIAILGFVYDAMFAGMPYQDPTPEMTKRYIQHAHVASALGVFGMAVSAAGLLASLIRRVALSRMSLVLKLGMGSFLLGIFLPATPGMFRGNWEPAGTNPGALLLISAGYQIFSAIQTYYQFRDEPSYDFRHFSDETLIPGLSGFAVVLAMSFVCLVAFVPRFRSGRLRIVSAVAILAGGFCLIRILYPGYAPVGNGYWYYPGAYFLMLAFPVASFGLLWTRPQPGQDNQAGHDSESQNVCQ